MTIALLSAASSVHTVRWANAFAERGHHVHLITQHVPVLGLDARVTVHRLPHLKGLGYLINGWHVSRLLAKLRPDVVNAHYATGYGGLARSARHYPLVINIWGSDVLDFPYKSWFHRRWLEGNLQSADRIVSTSHYMAKRTNRSYAGLSPISVVPFGVDTATFSPGDERPHSGPLVIGTVKSLAHVYGIDVLLRAFAALEARLRDNARLRIVGDGPQHKELAQLADTLGVAQQVDFVGAVPHARVPAELRSMDIFVALSRSESFGVAVVEASACGLPVVVSDVGGLPEVVQHGTTGFIVPNDDPDSGAAAISELIASAELRYRMGSAGRSFVEANYAWSHCVDRQMEVFEMVLEERKRA
jgi:glycosyltransferase involved in cell wall biosynthesis